MVDTGLRPFHAMEILAQARALEAAGRTILHLELGEPAAPPAPGVIAAAGRALASPQGYTHAKGRLTLREALAADYAARHGVSVDPEAIIVTMGSSAGFILAFHSALSVGDAVAVTRPGYPAYLNTLSGLGFEAVEIPVTAAEGWHLTGAAIAAAFARRPFRALLFASPANPTGAAVDHAGLADIVETCQRLGVLLISDEIYHGLDYRGLSVSALELADDCIVINSFSKYHCMTGWRIGWMVLPPALVRRAEMLQQNFFISAPTLSQIAAEAALGERDYAEARKAEYATNRTLLAAGLADLGFSDVRPADGAFYAYAGITRFGGGSMAFCQRLLHEAGVAATPGIDFDRVSGGDYVRFSFAGARDTIAMALDRMRAVTSVAI